MSKSHGNTSMYVDTVINFANYHIHTLPHTYTTIHILRTTYRMSDHKGPYSRKRNNFSPGISLTMQIYSSFDCKLILPAQHDK